MAMAKGSSAFRVGATLVAAVVGGLFSASARADHVVVLDTFFPGDVSTSPSAGVGRSDVDGLSARLGQPFTLSQATTITDLLVALHGTGTDTLGIRGTTFDGATAIPTSSFLFSTTLTNPVANASVTGLNWTLAAGQYWLVAEAATDGTRTFWDSGRGGGNTAVGALNTGFPNAQVSWYFSDIGPRAARIDGVSPVPEPSAWMTFGVGLGVLAVVGKRRAGARREGLSS